MLEAAAGMPGVVRRTLEAYAATQEEEGKLEDLLIGFLDPAEHVEPAAQVVPGETKDDDDEQPDTGLTLSSRQNEWQLSRSKMTRHSGRSRNTVAARRRSQRARSAGSGVPVFQVRAEALRFSSLRCQRPTSRDP